MPTPTQKSSSDVSVFRVRLKFHDDLTFFLKSKTSSGIIDRNLGEKTSAKDVIESCGIPHPEVDLIRKNKEPVDFSYPIVKDADIDVYPVQSRYLLFTEKRLQVRAIMRFVAIWPSRDSRTEPALARVRCRLRPASARSQ